MTNTLSTQSSLNIPTVSFIGGTYKILTFDVVDTAGSAVDLSGFNCYWALAQYGNSEAISILKDGEIDPIIKGRFKVTLYSTDTSGLSGKYIQQPMLSGNPGYEFRLGQGIVEIIPANGLLSVEQANSYITELLSLSQETSASVAYIHLIVNATSASVAATSASVIALSASALNTSASLTGLSASVISLSASAIRASGSLTGLTASAVSVSGCVVAMSASVVALSASAVNTSASLTEISASVISLSASATSASMLLSIISASMVADTPNRRFFNVLINSTTGSLTTADVAMIRIPDYMNGWVLTDASACCNVASTSGSPRFTVGKSASTLNAYTSMLTSDIYIGQGKWDSIYASSGSIVVVSATASAVSGGDRVRVTTVASGSSCTFATVVLCFRAPI